MEPTPESFDVLLAWRSAYEPDASDLEKVTGVIRAASLGILDQEFFVVREATAPNQDVVIPRSGLRVLVDYYPEIGRFHIASIFEDPDANDDDPWALP